MGKSLKVQLPNKRRLSLKRDVSLFSWPRAGGLRAGLVLRSDTSVPPTSSMGLLMTATNVNWHGLLSNSGNKSNEELLGAKQECLKEKISVIF